MVLISEAKMAGGRKERRGEFCKLLRPCDNDRIREAKDAS